MAKKKKVTEPGIEQEKLLNDIVENGRDIICLRGRKWKVGWIRNRARRKLTDISLKEKDEDKVIAKSVAALLLNGYFKIFFFYGFLWRWFYYVMQYSEDELLPVIELCKKKVPVEPFCLATIYLTEMRDTMMSMTREEVARIRQESSGARPGLSEKSTDASPNL